MLYVYGSDKHTTILQLKIIKNKSKLFCCEIVQFINEGAFKEKLKTV